jgi:histidinol-phosphate aminotransferase
MSAENIDIQSLIRPHLRNFKPYSSARSEYTGRHAIFLDANENPFGSAYGTDYNRYPDPFNTHLRQKAAALRGVTKENVFAGNGSDEAIDLLYRAFCEPGMDHVITCPPTYGMYETCAKLNNITLKEVLLTDDFQLDIASVSACINKHSKMIFLCSPNNPTGNLLHTQDIVWVLEHFTGLVVIDEAYIDFSPVDSWVSKLDQYPNLVVLQTLSKAWGMAGIRLGLAYAHPDVIEVLNAIKPPYNINVLTQHAGLQAMGNTSAKDRFVRDILLQMQRIEQELRKLPYVHKVYSSDANFLLVKVDDPDALYQFLVERKVIVRNRNKTPKCEGCVRISAGNREETDELIHHLHEFASI